MQYNTIQIYNARKVTPKCKSEVRIVSHQVKIQLTFQFLESQEEMISFKPFLKEGREFELRRERVEVDSIFR